ncbi:TIR-NBS-LRR RCT1 resistance protein, partial [Trifolium medium]|nr:TIR-NBS-LRR RCT1 resistance protein [Trifolium medium]
NESSDIKNIVENVTRLLDRTELFVAEHPVGVESRVQAATKLLNIQNSEDVLLLGIWGMGGMGKTTIAKAIYNQIGSKFEGRSFLLNIREFWETDSNQVSLQQQILSDVYKTTRFKIRDIESGKNILKQRLAQNRILLVLDDVNDLDQLKAFFGSREWFGPGSRIIITTRDIRLLRSCGVDQVYTIEEMNKSESLELFSWHAFKQPCPTKDFAAHSTDVIAYSGSLPLALQVLGSYLSDCCEISEWQKVLEKLKCIPHDQVQTKLKLSFDGLKDVTEKQIFLDITCFFIGVDQNDVIQILNGCGFFADVGIKVLLERSLLTVDNKNKLRMHALLRDMGRQIIYEESPFDPELRSRLWRHAEVVDVLSKHKGTEAVKGLALEFPRKNTVCLNTKAFKKMNKLRLLQLAWVKLKGDFKYLSRDLRWLCWHGFPKTYAPSEFQQESLVAIEFKHSKLKRIWIKNQMLENLTILNLSHSLYLTETPDFSYLPNLEKLVLKDCPSLPTVSNSIGSLHKLLLINLTDCTGLRKLPRSIYKLKSLETLILSGCSMIDKLEEDLVQMESLTNLICDKTAITKVPFSIVRSKSIGYISLCGFEGFSRDVIPSVIQSWMSPTNNVISLVQRSASITSVVSLDLLKLRSFYVECGSDLQLTQGVARILHVLKASNCQNREASAISTTSQISDMYTSPLIDDCLGQFRTSESKNYLKTLLIQMGTKCQVSNSAQDSILQTADGTWDSFLPPCDKESNWLTFSCK